jgi:hypothetical protein
MRHSILCAPTWNSIGYIKALSFQRDSPNIIPIKINRPTAAVTQNPSSPVLAVSSAQSLQTLEGHVQALPKKSAEVNKPIFGKDPSAP